MGQLLVGICGSIAHDTPSLLNPFVVLKDPDVQALVLQVNRQPVLREELCSAHPEFTPDVQNLLELGVLHEDHNGVRVNFTLFDAADRTRVYSVAEEFSLPLAERIAARREDLFRLLASYPNPHVAAEKLSFIIVGCYLLDWGALRFLEHLGFVASPKQQPGDNHYTLWAEEKGGRSLKAVYWGGHSHSAGPYLFHTFGDHHEDTKRRAFPDLLSSAPDIDLQDMGRVLEAIGHDGKSKEELRDIGVDNKLPAESLELLGQLHYIDKSDARWTLQVPYFTIDRPADVELIAEVGSIVFPVVSDWMTGNFEGIQQALAGIRPLENGVPFEEVMVQVWHYLFGLTNRELARMGIIHDTYAPGSVHRGYLPGLIKGEVLEKVMDRFC